MIGRPKKYVAQTKFQFFWVLAEEYHLCKLFCVCFVCDLCDAARFLCCERASGQRSGDVVMPTRFEYKIPKKEKVNEKNRQTVRSQPLHTAHIQLLSHLSLSPADGRQTEIFWPPSAACLTFFYSNKNKIFPSECQPVVPNSVWYAVWYATACFMPANMHKFISCLPAIILMWLLSFKNWG